MRVFILFYCLAIFHMLFYLSYISSTFDILFYFWYDSKIIILYHWHVCV